jgi:hypothetical protein
MKNTRKLLQKLREDGYSSQLNESVSQLLKNEGYTGNLPKRLFEFLVEKGYAGHLTEKLSQWDDEDFPLAGTQAQYWRLIFTELGSFPGSALSELEWYSTVGGANIATGGTPIAGNSEFGGSAAEAYDGDKTTSFWACNGIGEDSWIGYNFGSPVAIKQFEITSRDGSDGNQVGNAWRLQYSSNGTDWETLKSYSDYDAWSASESRKYET